MTEDVASPSYQAMFILPADTELTPFLSWNKLLFRRGELSQPETFLFDSCFSYLKPENFTRLPFLTYVPISSYSYFSIDIDTRLSRRSGEYGEYVVSLVL